MEWSTPLFLLALYAAGYLVSLVVMYEPFPQRLWTALLWPLGIVAGIATVTFLTLFSLYVWPLLGITVAALVGLGLVAAYW